MVTTMRVVHVSLMAALLASGCSSCGPDGPEDSSHFTAVFREVSFAGKDVAQVVDGCLIRHPREWRFRDTLWALVENVPRPEGKGAPADSPCWRGEVWDSGFYRQSADTLDFFTWQPNTGQQFGSRIDTATFEFVIGGFLRGDSLIFPGDGLHTFDQVFLRGRGATSR